MPSIFEFLFCYIVSASISIPKTKAYLTEGIPVGLLAPY